MTAKTRTLDLEITGRTLKEIYSKACRLLSVSGPRALRLEVVETGAEVYVSLYDGQSYIKSANGRLIG